MVLRLLLLFSAAFSQSPEELQEAFAMAMNHSSPEQLKQLREEMEAKNQTLEYDRSTNIDTNQQAAEEEDYFTSALNVLTNDSSPQDALVKVLTFVQELMEDAGIASYAHQLGILDALYKRVFDERPEISSLAAWAIGSAMQNAAQVQREFLSLDGGNSLGKLIAHFMTLEYSPRLLYAVSVLLDNPDAVEIAHQHGLFSWAWNKLTPEWPGSAKTASMLFSALKSATEPPEWVNSLTEDPLTPLLHHARKERNIDLYERLCFLMHKLAQLGPEKWRETWESEAQKAITDCVGIWDSDLCANLLEIRVSPVKEEL